MGWENQHNIWFQLFSSLRFFFLHVILTVLDDVGRNDDSCDDSDSNTSECNPTDYSDSRDCLNYFDGNNGKYKDEKTKNNIKQIQYSCFFIFK